MRYGCCTDIKNYALLEELGYDCIELEGKAVHAMDDAAFEAAAATVAAGKIPCNGVNAYCPPSLSIVGPGFDPDAVRAYAERLLPRVRRLGGKTAGIGAPASRKLPEGFDRALARRQLLDFLRITGEVAAREGITLLLEPLTPKSCNFLNYTDEAREIVEEVNSPGLFMVYDLFHALGAGEDVEPLKRAMPYVRHLHVSTDEPEGRGYLRDGYWEVFKPMLAYIRESGYDGTFSVEANIGDVVEGAASTLRILKQQLGR